MTKISVSPKTYQHYVDKYGEEVFGQIFKPNPDHCDHPHLRLQATATHVEHRGNRQWQIYEHCLDCGQQSYGPRIFESR